jgi:hypothetical protein
MSLLQAYFRDGAVHEERAGLSPQRQSFFDFAVGFAFAIFFSFSSNARSSSSVPISPAFAGPRMSHRILLTRGFRIGMPNIILVGREKVSGLDIAPSGGELFIQPFQNLDGGRESLLEMGKARVDPKHRGVLGFDQRRDVVGGINVIRHADRRAAAGTADEIHRTRRIRDAAVENHLEFGSAAGGTFGISHEFAPRLDRMAG